MPVKKQALQGGVQVHQPSGEFKDWAMPELASTGQRFTMAVVVSFGYLIPRRMLEYFDFRAVNMHPSLLPRYAPSGFAS